MEMIRAIGAALRFARQTAAVPCMLLSPLICSSTGQAWEICQRVEQLPLVSEAERKKVTEVLAGQYEESVSLDIRRMGKSYKQEKSHYLAWANDRLCAQSRCEFQVLQERGDVVVDLFAFQGSGIAWYEPYRQGAYWKAHEDSYEFYAFETADGARIAIAFPRTTNKIFIQALRLDASKLPPCQR